MFDAKTAKKIQDAIAVHNRIVPTLEDIMVRMSLVPSFTSGSSQVYAIQGGDFTILVNTFYCKNGKLLDVSVKLVSW